jgi:hypothetical protein
MIIIIIIIHILIILSNNCQTIFLLFRIVKNTTILPLFQKNTILSLFQNYHSSKAINWFDKLTLNNLWLHVMLEHLSEIFCLMNCTWLQVVAKVQLMMMDCWVLKCFNKN